MESDKTIYKNFSKVVRAEDNSKKRAVGDAVFADKRVNSGQSAMCRILDVRHYKKHDYRLKCVEFGNDGDEMSVKPHRSRYVTKYVDRSNWHWSRDEVAHAERASRCGQWISRNLQ